MTIEDWKPGDTVRVTYEVETTEVCFFGTSPSTRNYSLTVVKRATLPVGTVARLTTGSWFGEVVIRTAAKTYPWKFLTKTYSADPDKLDGLTDQGVQAFDPCILVNVTEL